MCDRVGNSLVMQAVLSPASDSPRAALNPAPPAPTTMASYSWSVTLYPRMVYHAHHVIACVSLPFAPIRPIPCVPPFVPSEICTILTDVEAFLAAWIAARRVAKAHEARASMLAASVVGEPCSCDAPPFLGSVRFPFPWGSKQKSWVKRSLSSFGMEGMENQELGDPRGSIPHRTVKKGF